MKQKISWPLVLFFLCVASAAYSQTILRPLSFGTVITRANSTESRVVVPRAGKAFSTNQIQLIDDAYPAELLVRHYPAYTELHLTALAPYELRATSDLSVPPFIVESLDIPLSIFTDVNGEAHLIVGATLKTTGDGRPYPDASYNGSIDIVVSY